MVVKTPKWERELWSHVSRGDGVNCPSYNDCQTREQGGWCASDNRKELELSSRFIDNEDFPLNLRKLDKFNFLRSVNPGGIFTSVERLANRYLEKAKVHYPPTPADLIALADDNRPVEVHLLPLKAYHGSIWRLNGSWIIQLNKNDTSARRRFTLFHEVFHILAHCKATPLFRKKETKITKITKMNEKGSFNELLADHFASSILLPREWVKAKWVEVKNLDRMVEIFEIPKPVVWITLKGMELV
ncbi:ImmA/IrrE family metallo-endopeptidase [Chloroflexota bacterium]